MLARAVVRLERRFPPRYNGYARLFRQGLPKICLLLQIIFSDASRVRNNCNQSAHLEPPSRKAADLNTLFDRVFSDAAERSVKGDLVEAYTLFVTDDRRADDQAAKNRDRDSVVVRFSQPEPTNSRNESLMHWIAHYRGHPEELTVIA